MTAIKQAFQNIKKEIQSLAVTGSPTLSLSFHPESRLKLVPVYTPSKNGDKAQENEFIPVYSDGCAVSGHLDIILPDNCMEFEYDEIAIYLVGHVICPEIDEDSVFLSHKISLHKKSGILTQNTEFDWRFAHPSLKLDSHYGSLFKCRYFIRAIINRPKIFQANIKLDHDFMVMNVVKLNTKKTIAMQVGVDDCLHIKFEYDNVNISTNGCLKGHVKVLSNSLKITTMQIQLVRRGTINTADRHRPQVINTSVLGKFEVMDGLPGDGEEIPVRMFLQRFKGVTNTQITDHFSVRFYANLGLIDKDGRRYFKTCELILFRTKMI
eukprot:UN01443